MLNKIIFPFLKGAAMGAANVIPGVSGGTIALITGIFERLINAIKSFDGTAFKLLLKGKLKEFAAYTDMFFLLYLFAGVFAAILSLARLLEYLFENHPIYVWAFFFGLVLASVWFVARTVRKWHAAAVISFLVGASIAISISVLTPAGRSVILLFVFVRRGSNLQYDTTRT